MNQQMWKAGKTTLYSVQTPVISTVGQGYAEAHGFNFWEHC